VSNPAEEHSRALQQTLDDLMDMQAELRAERDQIKSTTFHSDREINRAYKEVDAKLDKVHDDIAIAKAARTLMGGRRSRSSRRRA
jgi:predicted  nucleic acid-binding Zn-ribbon protein